MAHKWPAIEGKGPSPCDDLIHEINRKRGAIIQEDSREPKKKNREQESHGVRP